MVEDFFKYLPSEIINNILLRLPVRSIASSKCVCKSWLDLLSTDEFVNSHLAKSVPSLAVLTGDWPLYRCKVIEFEDDLESRDFRYNPLTEFDFPKKALIVGAANGLLLLRKPGNPFTEVIFYVCNPITRHYVEIFGPKEVFLSRGTFGFGASRTSGQYLVGPKEVLLWEGAYGFGASRISGQYKVVRIIDISECYVYTLGTGSWRHVAGEASRVSFFFEHYDSIFGAFLNGHIYWTVTVLSSPLITCFDVETECFSSFSAPASRGGGGLSVLRDCLYFCEWKDKIVVWLMKEYGVEKSWSKEYVFNFNSLRDYGYNDVYPVKVFENGDMLMLWYDMVLVFYSNKTKTIQRIGSVCDLQVDYINISSMALTPSFLSLKGLGMENVISF